MFLRNGDFRIYPIYSKNSLCLPGVKPLQVRRFPDLISALAGDRDLYKNYTENLYQDPLS